ncbi:MAG: pyroglutamyl-peptidase I [Limnohabitans sp.]|nr:pyroglutamyl-peptidase I [Limnohabitans sp.]
MRFLLTGFEPFGGGVQNSSREVVDYFNRHTLEDIEIDGVCLPCVFHQSLDVLSQAINQRAYDAVIALGQADIRQAISIERIAINVDDARIADNQGNQPIDESIVVNGLDAYFSALPIKYLASSLHEQGIAVEVSQTAGTFACNHVFYYLQHTLFKTGIPSGFVHLPALPHASPFHSSTVMTLENMTQGITALLISLKEHILTKSTDKKWSAGAID